MHRRPKNILASGLWILSLGLFLIQSAVGEKIRLMGANISSGNLQSYDPGEGIRIFQGLKPDVVMIQEFNYGNKTAAAIRQFVNTAFGTNFHYFQETGAQIPNGIISRFPILESGEWTDPKVSNRDFAWARIDIPGSRDLWAISVHFLTSGSSVRNEEATALIAKIKALVPETDFLVIGGDFNSDSRSESQFSTLGQVVYTGTPHPVDQNNNPNTNASRAKPYDSVFADNDLRQYQTSVVIGTSSFPNGLVVDTRVFNPISAISPAVASDSAASNMQHMAIVKDFDVPVDPVIASSATLVPGKVGMTYSQTLSANSGTAPYTWSVTSGSIPGLTLGSTGTLSGTPNTAGSYNLTVKVTDAASSTASKTFSISIAPPLLIESPSSLPGGTTGVVYSYALAASGGTSPYTWTATAGNLPAGLSLSGVGTITGIPSQAGTFNFTTRVNDATESNTSRSFSVTILEPVIRFLEQYSLAATAITADSDDDGVANLTEFILGGNPLLADPMILPSLTHDPGTGNISYSFRVLNAKGSTTWRIEYSTDLLTWKTAVSGQQGVVISITPDGTTSSVNATLPTPVGGMFVRLTVLQP